MSDIDELKNILINKMLFEIENINEASTYEGDKTVSIIINNLAAAYKALNDGGET